MRVSKPANQHDCFSSLKEQFSTHSSATFNPYQFSAPNLAVNYYQVDSPGDEMLHLLKTKYMTFLALTGLYSAIQIKIDAFIETIDSETQP